MSRWWRAYDEAVDDPKLLLLSDRAHRAWFNLMCLASIGGGRLPERKVIELKLRLPAAKVQAVMDELTAAGLLDQDETGLTPHNWNGRQYKSDTSEPASSKKDSYVYVIGSAWGASALKIGFSKNPWARIVELQTAHHEKLEVLATFRCKSHSEVDIHGLLKAYRKQGEWFALPARIYVAIHGAADRSCNYDSLVEELRNLLRSTTTEAETENRIQKERKEDAPSGASSAAYFFESGVIRLSEKDFRKWGEAFAFLELKAELISLTQWAGQQKDWFFAVSGALAKRNREIAEVRKKPPKTLTKAEEIYRSGII